MMNQTLPSDHCKSFHSGISISRWPRARARARVATAPADPGVRRVACGAAADPDALPGNDEHPSNGWFIYGLYICICIYIYIWEYMVYIWFVYG